MYARNNVNEMHARICTVIAELLFELTDGTKHKEY